MRVSNRRWSLVVGEAALNERTLVCFGMEILSFATVGGEKSATCSGNYLTDAIACLRAAVSSAESLTGGWQANPEQMMATDLLSFSAGRLGMVSAKAGGRFCATA